jgi:hypothetical protein
MIKTILLAGASVLAMATTAAEAQTTYNTPGDYTFLAPSTGLYKVEVWGAQGGSSANAAGGSYTGGLGAGVWTEVSLTAGQSLYIFVGQQGQSAASNGGGGGGGASGVQLSPSSPFADGGLIAGGGGGAGLYGAGGPGQNPSFFAPAAPGRGDYGGGYGGFSGDPGGFGIGGAPGGGLGTYHPGHGYQGKGFYDGGAGGNGGAGSGAYGSGHSYAGGAGGFGWSGGGGGYFSGGGGGGVSGGGGGGVFNSSGPGYSYRGAGGGGGASYIFYFGGGSLRGETGDGQVEILPGVIPEPAEWMLLLMGLGGAGYMLRRERERLARLMMG